MASNPGIKVTAVGAELDTVDVVALALAVGRVARGMTFTEHEARLCYTGAEAFLKVRHERKEGERRRYREATGEDLP